MSKRPRFRDGREEIGNGKPMHKEDFYRKDTPDGERQEFKPPKKAPAKEKRRYCLMCKEIYTTNDNECPECGAELGI